MKRLTIGKVRSLGSLTPNSLVLGDCLEGMKFVPDKSVDLILTDLPYGTTKNRWDILIPFEPLWAQYKRVIKDNGAIVLTASQPFTTDLIASNRDMFRYSLIWDKTKGGNHLLAKRMPIKSHEDVLIFYKKQPTYNPQMEVRGKVRKKGGGKASANFGVVPTVSYNNEYYPKSILTFSTGSRKDHHHPTQKPVELMAYLIKTYTNEGDVVLDSCMGAGSTGVAAVSTNRKFLGIELESEYFDVANKRIGDAGN
jgi:site-specific DNA-methyltransferase (adenine-specific)